MPPDCRGPRPLTIAGGHWLRSSDAAPQTGDPMATTTLDPANLKPTDHYPIISADCHAGASHAVYREYLAKRVPRRLRRVAGQVQEPLQGPARQRRPHPQLGQREAATATRSATTSSARWSSRTRCRRSSRASCSSHRSPLPRPTSTGSPGSVPTTAGSSTGAASSPSAAPASARSSSTTSTTRSRTCSWIKEHGLRGGILLPTLAPDVTWMPPITDRVLRPPLGGVRRPRRRRQLAQRHRFAQLRQAPGRGADADERDPLLLAAPARAPAARRACSNGTRSSSTASPSSVARGSPPMLTQLDNLIERVRERLERARCATPPTTCRSRCRPPRCSTRAATSG